MSDTKRILVKRITSGIPTIGVKKVNGLDGFISLLDSSDILITIDSAAGTFTFENTSTLDTVTGRGDSTSNSVTFGDITTTGRIKGPSTMILDPNGDNAITGELRVLGDLRVDGTTTSVNSTEVSFNDKNIVLGDSASLASDLNGAGLTIGNDALFAPNPAPLFTYNYTNNRFELNRDLFINDGITTDSASITVLTVDSATFNRIKGEIHGSYIDSNSIENDRLVNSSVTFTDGTDSQVVDLGETVTFNGGADLTATVSPTNTVTFSHDPSGVTAGTYGSVSEIPVFTVDSQGHVDSVANVSISTTLSLVSDSDSGSVSLLDSSMSINEGEGIDISLSGTTFTVSAEDATVNNKGIASFDSGDFEVSSGQVSIKTAGVGNSQLENDTVTIGSTGIALGDSSDTLSGLTQVTTTNLNVTDSATIVDANITGIATINQADITTLDVTDSATIVDATVTGIATINQATITTLDVIDSATIADLTVDSDANLTHVYVSDLTDNRVVIAGASGRLEDDANLTYDGSTLTVANNTASTSSANGALVVTGGVGIGGALNVGGNLEILGDFTVTGTTTTIDVQTLSVSDPLIHLADSNESADEVDIGFVAHYYDAALGGKQHTGLFRDATNDKYYLFAQYQDSALDSSPRSNVIDRSDPSFVLADFNAATVFADTFSGTVSADSITTTNFTATTVDINGGTIDGTTIATSDITVGASKTLDVSAGTLTLANDQISGDKVEGGTINAVTINNLTSGNVNIDGGFIDGTAIGHTTPDSGTFTNLVRTSPAGVTAGEYGSVTEIPVITVDASGFIDSISEVTIQDASTTNKGIASFDASDFVVTSGAVSLATDITIDSNLQVNTLTVVDSATIGGNLTFVDSDDIIMPDNSRIKLGDAGDLAILHNGTSTLFNNNTGTLQFNNFQDDGAIVFNTDDGAGGTTNYIRMTGSTGEVKLYHYGNQKFNTTSTGVEVTGTVTADGLTVDTDTLHVDATNNRVGVGTASPSEKLHVVGNVQIDSDLTVNRYINSSKLTTDSTGAHITGEIDLNDLASFQTDSATTSTLTTTSIAEFPVATYGGAKFVVTAFNTVTKNRHITELLITHDSATAVATEYGSVRTDSDLVSYDVDINNSNVRLLATANTTDSITYRVIETLLNA